LCQGRRREGEGGGRGRREEEGGSLEWGREREIRKVKRREGCGSLG
jgi:hypothetical protein